LSETTVIDTPQGIQVYQYLVAISAIKLEKQGLRHSRGSVRLRWAVRLGLGRQATHDEILTALRAKCKELGHETRL
jgi:hypothetical protein